MIVPKYQNHNIRLYIYIYIEIVDVVFYRKAILVNAHVRCHVIVMLLNSHPYYDMVILILVIFVGPPSFLNQFWEIRTRVHGSMSLVQAYP